MPINISDLRTAAVEYARKGWKVHPLKPRKKEPNSPHGCHDAIADIEKIDKWWAEHPDDNIGLATGHSFFVLDIDPEGEQWFESNDLPETLQERTVRGGRHLIYALPANVTIRNSVGRLAPGVDIRGLGGYIVASPSVVMACPSCRLSYDKGHKPGCTEKSHSFPVSYEWLDCDGVVPESTPAEAPLWIVDAIQKLSTPSPSKKFTLPDHIPHGVQHRTLMEYGCSLRSKTLMDEDDIYTHLVEASQRCEKIPPASHMRKMAKSIMKYPQGLSDTFAERALNKLVSYIDQQLKTPPPVADSSLNPPITDELLFANPISTAIAADDPKQVWAAIDFLASLDEDEYQSYRLDIKSHFKAKLPIASLDEARRKQQRKTDDGSADEKKISPNDIADKILREHAIINVDRYLYEYTENHWKSISDDRLKALAIQYEGKFQTSMRRRSEISSYIQATTHRRHQQWRILKPYEIPVSNGVIDIRTMELRPHRREDYLQACIPVAYNPSAQCTLLMQCLDAYFGSDESKPKALQDFFGYCLMPHAKYKKALICYGESDCGKSTISTLLRILVGRENMCSVSVEDMDDARKRTPLMGKMVNAMTELSTNAVIADGGFKTLVSTEEPVQMDPKFLPAVMDLPICKHVIITNTLPTVNDKSKGTFNRLLLVHFENVIPVSQQDRGIEEKLSREAEGILLWALEGAQRLFLANGTFTPVGGAEMKSYIEDQNPFSRFVAEQCHLTTEQGTFLHHLRSAFESWYGQRTRPQLIAQWVRSAGFEVTKRRYLLGQNRGFVVSGVALPTVGGVSQSFRWGGTGEVVARLDEE